MDRFMITSLIYGLFSETVLTLSDKFHSIDKKKRMKEAGTSIPDSAFAVYMRTGETFEVRVTKKKNWK